MFWGFSFLCYVSVLIDASKVNSGNPLFKSLAVDSDTDDLVDQVFFKERRFNVRKAEQICNKNTLHACHGKLSLPKASSSKDDEAHIFVVGGRNSAPREYPHMVLIGYGEYAEVRWLCGGSLISEQYVLSAAHCASTNAGSAAWIRLGELNLGTKNEDASTMDFEILQRFVHPEYNGPILYNDIALFKFKGVASFTAYIRPICLNIFENFNTLKVTAIGWGSTGYGERESDHLLSVDLDIQEYSDCDRIYRGDRLPYGFNTSTMICAGYSPGGKDTCQGDSGGPLQFLNANAGCNLTYTQVGIVSFGEGCAQPETPAIYTKISYFIPWIESIVWK